MGKYDYTQKIVISRNITTLVNFLHLSARTKSTIRLMNKV